MRRPQLIVCERRNEWSTALRGILPQGVSLRQTRSLAECRAELAEAPTSLVGVELAGDNVQGVLDFLDDLARHHPGARAVVLCRRDMAPFEWLAREAGAAHVVFSPRDCRHLAGLLSRHFQRYAPPRAKLAAQIWDALPWSEAARIS